MKDLDTASLSADTPLATIALRSDAHAAVLDRHRLDFCCGGARTLSDACRACGLDVDAVLADLASEASARAAAAKLPDWSERPIPELVDFIVGTHHTYTRAALSRIAPLLAKVVARHGDHRTELADVADAFYKLAEELGPHLLREERVLFPYIQALASPEGAPPPPFGTQGPGQSGGRLRAVGGVLVQPGDAVPQGGAALHAGQPPRPAAGAAAAG
jgi:regulator of cell morphogenesis and NO signaling